MLLLLKVVKSFSPCFETMLPCDLHWPQDVVELMLHKVHCLVLKRLCSFQTGLSWNIVLRLTLRELVLFIEVKGSLVMWIRTDMPQLTAPLSEPSWELLDHLFHMLTTATWVSLRTFNSRAIQANHRILTNIVLLF